jgi:queuine tRNA-ribosyltransferase
MARLNSIKIKGKTYSLPVYLPDATLGVVRSLDSKDIKNTGIKGVVINTYHLINTPGTKILDKIKGIKSFMNYQGLTASDSGGFQLFSLINKNPNLGRVTDEGVILYTDTKKQHKKLFTPEDSIKAQFSINSDIMICLDDFTPPDASKKRLEQSIDRTIAWAKRCRSEFDKQLKKNKFTKNNRPLLFAVVQGHRNKNLRKHCADELIKIGFDGYGFGGWPFKDNGEFDYEISQVIADITPDDKPRFALGIGGPENIVRLSKMGFDIFDCVLPTRDARHKRLYTFTQDPKKLIPTSRDKKFFEYIYIDKAKHNNDFSPISEFCDCKTCKNHTVAYLHHLFKIKDNSAFRLATIHNLRFYSMLMENIKKQPV